MKKIHINNNHHAQLRRLIKVSGKSRFRVINEVMIAGLIEVANKVLADHDDNKKT